MKKNIHFIILAILVVIICGYYDMHHIFFLRPFGNHLWRQCDGASFTWTYTHVSMNIFNPRTINVFGIDGKMWAELPLFYYPAAILNKLFGEHESYIRIMHFATFILGLFAVSAISMKLTRDKIISILLPLLLLSNGIIVFYANNFLPDVAAISVGFIALYYFIRSRESDKNRYLILASILFTIAGLLKPTALNIYFCLMIMYIFEQVLKISISEKPIFKRKDIILFSSVLLINIAFYLYAIRYNIVNKSQYIQAFIKPIWIPSEVSLSENYRRLIQERLPYFFDFTVIYLCIGLLLFILFTTTKKYLWITIFCSSMLLVLTANYLLFGHQFYHHEYYLIVFAPIILSVVLLSYKRLLIFDWKWNKNISFTLFLVLVFFINMNVHKTKRYIDNLRYDFVWDDAFEDYKNITPLLRKNGITEKDLVLSWGDQTTSVSLYLMNQRGWTSYQIPGWSVGVCKQAGAKYLVTNKLLNGEDSTLIPFKKNLIVKNGNVEVYRL
jgi:hypothetical protein